MEVKIWKISYLFLQLLMLSSIHGASWREAKQEEVRPRKCPHYDSQKNFTPQKFAGTWFVANQFQTFGHRHFLECQQLDLTAVPGNDLSFDIKGYVRATPNLGIQTLGEAVIPDANIPSVMRWAWYYFPNIIDFVSVVDTNYDNYAVIILCQDFGLLHTVYPILMTREKPMNVTDTYTKSYKLIRSLLYGYTQLPRGTRSPLEPIYDLAHGDDLHSTASVALRLLTHMVNNKEHSRNRSLPKVAALTCAKKPVSCAVGDFSP